MLYSKLPKPKYLVPEVSSNLLMVSSEVTLHIEALKAVSFINHF
jgi:hypothetical protein